MNRRLAALAGLAVVLAAGASHGQENVSRRYYYEEIFQPFFAVAKDRPDLYRAQRPGAEASPFPVRKEKSAFRVFILGGSTAKIYHADLREDLQMALPKRKVEVINCGMPGYDSSRALLIEREVLGYQPDLLVLIPSHNESADFSPVPLWRVRVETWAASARILRFLRRWLGPPPAARERTFAESQHGTVAAFENTLRESFRTAARRGVPVAVMIPPLNYRDSPAAHPLPRDPAFLRGWILFLKRRYSAAERAFRRSLASQPPDAQAVTYFLLGRCQEALGRLAEARESFVSAIRRERMFSGRCTAACQQMIRNAASQEGAISFDMDREFRARAWPRMPGLELFDDQVHWKRALNPLVSLALIDALRRSPAFRSLPWDEQGLKSLRAPSPLLRREPGQSDLATLRYAFAEIAQAAASELSPRALFFLNAVHERRPSWFEDIQALVRQAEKEPDLEGRVWGMPRLKALSAGLYRHLSHMFLMAGDTPRARLSAALAVLKDPSKPGAWIDQALAQGLDGRKAEALQSLREAMRQASAEPAAWHDSGQEAETIIETLGLGRRDDLYAGSSFHSIELAQSAAQAGDITRALRSLQAGDAGGARAALVRAEGLKPGEDELRRIAAIYQEVGERGRASSILESLFARHPQDAGLEIDLAELAFRSGRRDDAARLLLRCESLGPGARDWRRMALLHQELGDYGAASRILERLLSQEPQNASLLADLGLCRYLAGDIAAATKALKQALRRDPRLLSAYLTLGSIYAAQKRWQEASDLYSLALRNQAPGASGPQIELIRREQKDLSPKTAAARR